ncbi:unnamed protein product [Camellia sinensis]
MALEVHNRLAKKNNEDYNRSIFELFHSCNHPCLCSNTFLCWEEQWCLLLQRLSPKKPAWLLRCLGSISMIVLSRGCDASILLVSTRSMLSEKRLNPNRDSVCGFEVIDEIKFALEKECPHTVSCADFLALTARDSTSLTGGPSWEVPLGRTDSKGVSLSGSNNNIPAPNNTFQTILTKFKLQGLDIVDLVALSVTQLEMPDAPTSGRGWQWASRLHT